MKRIRADVWLGMAGTAWLAWHVIRFPVWTVDDAFIVARYAENAIAHGELAFNAGAGAADRVEGFTSPLAMFIAVIARLVHVDPVHATKLVCMAAALVTPLLVVGLARALRATPLAGGLAAFVFVIHPEHAMHAGSGLETELFVACGLGLFTAFAQVLARKTRPFHFIVLAIVTTLARPEGLALVAVLVGAVLVVAPSARRRALVKSFGLGIALPITVLALVRYAYFGSLVPNTFYAKHGSWNDAHLSDLAAILDVGVVDLAVIALVLWLLARVVALRRVRLGPRVLVASAAAVLGLLVHLFAYARSEPIMDYGRRFAWHGMPFVAVLTIAALDTIVRAAPRLVHIRRIALAAIFVLAAVATFSGFIRARPTAEREMVWASRQAASVVPLQLPTIEWLSKNTPEDALVAVYPDAGRIPLATGRRTIDFGKLNDRVLARATTDAEVVDYFFERRPDIIVMGRKASGRYFDSGAEALIANPRFAAEYELAKRIDRDSLSDAYEIYRKVQR